MTTRPEISLFRSALPFWMSLGLVPLGVIGAVYGGWTVFLLVLFTWVLFDILDFVLGLNTENADTETAETDLFWYRLITAMWFPIQFCLTFGLIWYVTVTDHLAVWEKTALFVGVGVLSGVVGIVYAHELMHQKNRVERGLGDLLLAQVLYSHFRSEHLRVHHLYVGTPRDPVSARYNEGFHRYFFRVLLDCPPSAWRAERALLARRGKGMMSLQNPFWLYGLLQAVMIVLALWIGGWQGLGLFLLQALVAVWQLELVNYIEHYGLTRRHLGDGKYEHVMPRHSWNSAHMASNWLLINLQRHSDHHYKPDRRFPLLQTYGDRDAPQLPYSYPVMGVLALVPPAWRRVMNPRVQAWRKRHYPDVSDWTAYKKGDLPMPKGAP
jgi:alkane 1-monooxygenase